MQVAMIEQTKMKNKKNVAIVEHNESKRWNEKRIRKGGALKAMTKMMTLPTKRSVPFV